MSKLKITHWRDFNGNQHVKLSFIERTKRRIIRLIRWVYNRIIFPAGVALAIAVLVAGYAEGYRLFMQDDLVPHAEAQKVSKDRLEEKVEELKWNLIEDLIKYESPKGTPLLIVDAPKGSYKCAEDKYSFGKLMFKPCTVTGAYKLYYNKTITREEAINIVISEKESKELAYDMIFKTKKGDKGLDHWYNSARKNGGDLQKQLKLIKELEN